MRRPNIPAITLSHLSVPADHTMSITDDIFAQLSGPALQQISQQLGTGQAQTAGAVAAALPMILGAMGHNASQPQGAESLLGALGRDHAASGGGIGDISGTSVTFPPIESHCIAVKEYPQLSARSQYPH